MASPVVKVVALFSLASGTLLTWVEGTWRQHDAVLWRALWETFRPGDVVVADRALCSYAALAALAARGVDVVMRLHQGRHVPRLGTRRCECTVTWRKPTRPRHWSPKDWQALPDELVVRIVRVRAVRKGFRSRTVLIATTLLDSAAYPAEEVAGLHLQRWTVELFFRDITTSMSKDMLAGCSPNMVRREIVMFAIAYNLVRAVMQDAADDYHVPVARLSFKGTLDTLRQWCAHVTEQSARALVGYYATLLDMIRKDRVPWRPWRVEPRAVKRRPKSYRLLTKPRHRMYVPPHHNRPKTRLRRCA